MQKVLQRIASAGIGAIAGTAVVLLAATPNFVPIISGATASPSTHATETYRELELFGRVFDEVRKDYVDTPNDTKLISSAIDGMVSKLDPHSNYMDAKSYQDMRAETNGEFSGLGMQVTLENGVVKVVSLMDDTPATKAGILVGDIITGVDGLATKDLPLDDAVAKLRGLPGTNVTLAIRRQHEPKPIIVTLTREIIKVHPVSFRDEGGNVGYIRITEFNELAGDELTNAVKNLSAEMPANQIKGYILDLRNNPGGLLDQAIAISDAFLTRGEIVSTRSRDPEESPTFLCKTRRFDRRQTARRLNQRWLGISLRDRRRRLTRSEARDHHRHTIVR